MNEFREELRALMEKHDVKLEVSVGQNMEGSIDSYQIFVTHVPTNISDSIKHDYQMNWDDEIELRPDDL